MSNFEKRPRCKIRTVRRPVVITAISMAPLLHPEIHAHCDVVVSIGSRSDYYFRTNDFHANEIERLGHFFISWLTGPPTLILGRKMFFLEKKSF
jgi:hypothetical protein